MFTLKFKNFSDEGESTTCISCVHYSVWRSKSVSDFIEVTVYKDFTSQEGVTYNVGQAKGKHYFDVCFVENQNGKTIDRIGF